MRSGCHEVISQFVSVNNPLLNNFFTTTLAIRQRLQFLIQTFNFFEARDNQAMAFCFFKFLGCFDLSVEDASISSVKQFIRMDTLP